MMLLTFIGVVLIAAFIAFIVFVVACLLANTNSIPRREVEEWPSCRCEHQQKSDESKMLIRDNGEVERVYEVTRSCLNCGKLTNRKREFVATPRGKDAMDQAWRILREIQPRFDEYGSGCLVCYPPEVAKAYLSDGEDAAIAKSRDLLGMDMETATISFQGTAGL